MIPLGMLGAATPRATGEDPYWSSTVSVLNFEGADGSTTFTDARGKVWTPSGNAQIDTSQGYNAGLFDGNDLISTPDHADLNFGSGLYTVELWLRPATVTGFQNVLRKSTGTNYAPITMALDGNKLRTRSSETNINWSIDQTSSISIAAGALVHVAAVRDASNVFRQYVGGAQSGTSAYSGGLMTNASPLYIGGQSDAVGGYSGLVRAMRVTKGVCRYPGGATFTPPDAPFPTS